MKFPNSWTLGAEDAMIKRAHEIVTDLILEHGVEITVSLETSYYTVASILGEEPDMINFISGIKYHIGEHTFETIRELRKALENKAFM
jgi:hypothetical protein